MCLQFRRGSGLHPCRALRRALHWFANATTRSMIRQLDPTMSRPDPCDIPTPSCCGQPQDSRTFTVGVYLDLTRRGGSTFLKMGTFVEAGATVTVTVAPTARSYLKLEQGPSRKGLTSVVFHACPGSSPSSYTRWVGGFQIRGPFPACIALDVQIAGEQTVRHLAIPIGAAGACKT